MKKSVAIVTALCAAICSAAIPSAVASAESGGLDYYPDEFSREATFEKLEDYEITDGGALFLDNGRAYEYKDGTLTAFPEPPAFDGFEEKGEFTLNGFFYSFNSDKILNVYETATAQHTPLEGFSLLKKYSGQAYAVKENVIYKLDGADYEAQTFEYRDYSSTKKILFGGTKEILQTFSKDTPRFVSIKSGSAMTEADIDGSNGEYFKTGRTLIAGSGVTAKAALLLGQTGAENGISIIAVSAGSQNTCYLLSSDNVISIDGRAIEEKTLGATVTVDDGYIYTAPYVSESTRLLSGGVEVKIKSGDGVKVVGEITKEDNPELARSFYKVEFTDADGKTHTGYVPAGYVSPFAFIENPPTETPDPDYTEDNLIKTVVLVIIVVVLVLAACGYIIYALTSGKFKKKK